MKKYRIVNKFRFTVSMVIMSLLIISAFNLAFGLLDVKGLEATEFVEVRVTSGDTLWAIATEHNTGGKDVREIVYLISEINDLDGNTIYPGDLLKVPVI